MLFGQRHLDVDGGEEGDGYLRLALVENENRIRQALKQMKRALTDIDQEVEAGIFALEP